MDISPFRTVGPCVPRTPVVIAVGHAGRSYPRALVAAARVPVDRLIGLEDRHADLLAAAAVDEGATVIVADMARAWIDLNRHPDELDGEMIDPPPPAVGLRDGPRIRAGLGLVPRRMAGVGDIWQGPIAAADLAGRIAGVHEPYHRAVADALDEAHAAHGVAVLIDLHSMPPLAGRDRGITVVVGDLNGASADPAVTTGAIDAARAAGYRVARNRPYAGGYGVDRHGRPRQGVHAVQIELCRSLYLDATFRLPGPGLVRAQQFVAALRRRLAHALPRHDQQAAE
ncbi:N-formylglutamate amidohydrolase [Sphingomonas prati]|uniref:N-formylglutamate amidohydrolase n=1 Tax=Sphingomonas prati TaxID=1843237 RepID=A0A7W9BT16_9SPHN|nr:N-formylglutamate amidohydrolase [Sphingomonas prati]MBB5729599.1 N-formylglutamate amidohydrolase [Sphingomonas prati]GGE76230.1 formiminoglutamase [Sphingomonas prati]